MNKEKSRNSMAAAATLCSAIDDIVAALLFEMHDEGLTPKESSEAIRVASVTAMLFMSRCLGIDFSKMAKAVQSTIKDGSAEYAMKQIEDFIEKMNAMSVKKDLH